MAVSALEFAARATMQTFGTLELPWGGFVMFQVGDMLVPGFGAPPEAFGLLSPNFAAPSPQGPLATAAGDTWVAVIGFGETPTAWAVLPYGNATRPSALRAPSRSLPCQRASARRRPGTGSR